jgi:hypothetical protein
MQTDKTIVRWVFIGDMFCAVVVTAIGFLSHYGEIRGLRIFSSLIPVLIGWLAIAPWLGNYRIGNIIDFRQAWRAALAAFLSAPLAAWLRGAWLNSAILPVFVGVLALTNSFSFLIWRALLAVLIKRVGRNG